MFDDSFPRFTDHARLVMYRANLEAQRYKTHEVSTEHVLLGLIPKGVGLGSTALHNLGIDERKVRSICSAPNELAHPVFHELPLGDKTRQLLNRAEYYQDAHEKHYIESEHLLLALCDTLCVGTWILSKVGLSVDDVKNEVYRLLRSGPKQEEKQPENNPENNSETSFDETKVEEKLNALIGRLLIEAKAEMKKLIPEDIPSRCRVGMEMELELL